MGASLALAGLGELAGCEKPVPPAQIVPQVEQPEQTLPGRPTYFTSTMPFDGGGRGVLVLSREGRPIKVDGNPDHPATLGGSDVFTQASILDLYDPDRAKTVTQAGIARPLSELQRQLTARLAAAPDGRGLRLLTRPVTSPTVAAQLADPLKRYPQAKWHVHDPLARPASPFAEPVDVVYDLSAASVVVSLDADFLFAEPGSLRYARQWSDGRRVRKDRPDDEPAVRRRAGDDDHRFDGRPPAARAAGRPWRTWPGRLGETFGVDVSQAGTGRVAAATVGDGRGGRPEAAAGLGRVARDPRPVSAAGRPGRGTRDQPAARQRRQDGHVHRPRRRARRGETLAELDDRPAGRVGRDAADPRRQPGLRRPGRLRLRRRAGRPDRPQTAGDAYAALTVHLATHYTETSYACQWHVPLAHWLESWGDDRAFDGHGLARPAADRPAVRRRDR